MGIKNLKKVILKHALNSIEKVKITKFKNKTITVDTNLMIYKYVTAVRKQGYDLKDLENGKITSHIIGIKSQITKLRNFKIEPIYVIDDGVPELKREILNKRKDIKNKASEKIKYVADKELKDNKIAFQQSFHITQEMIDDLIELFKELKVKYILSPEGKEADAVCAELILNGTASAVFSTDMDMLPYNATIMIIDIDFKNEIMTIITLNKVLNGLNMNYEQFIELCILLGSDYCCTIPSIGHVRAYNLLIEFKNIKNIIDEYVKKKKIDWNGNQINKFLDKVNKTKLLFMNK